MFRGRTLGVLKIELDLSEALEAVVPHPCVALIAAHVGIEDRGRCADKWLMGVCDWTWRVKVHLQLSVELLVQVREAAEAEAIKIFGRNLHELLLAAPAGPKAVLGLDPGIRTGCKVAVVDATGKLLETATIYPLQPRNDWQGSLTTLARLVVQHGVELISIGNGTGSRETDKLATEVIKLVAAQKPDQKVVKIVVSEAGASVYSASAFAAAEFPDLDVSLRGAVSIARRLQDPLAELVKIDPKAIGVGQYQHDVNQRALARSLDATVEDCVNAVGVDVNTASAPLLERVSGLNKVFAKNIVEYRDANGPFPESHHDTQGTASGRQDFRAGRRISTHQRRRQPAGPFFGSPGSLSGGRAHSRAHQQRHRRRHGPAGGLEGLSPANLLMRSSACRRCVIS